MYVSIFCALRGSQNSTVALSQVMNHGFWSTTLETKCQIWEWHTANSPHPKKARMSKSKIKSMLICFFESRGIVHKEFVPPGQTVNQTFIGNSLKDSGKGWHMCNQASHALGYCTRTTPHVTRQSPSMNLWQNNIPVVPVTTFFLRLKSS